MRQFFCLVLFISSLKFASAQEPEMLPLEVYGSLPKVSQMAISPSGESIAYRLNSEGRDMLVSFNLKENKMTGAIDVNEIRPVNMHFVNEDTLILKAKKSSKLFGYRGRHDISIAFSYRISENRVRQLLTPGDGIHDGQINLGKVVGISRDGNFAYMPAKKTASERALMKVNLNAKRTPKSVKRGRYDVKDYFIYNDKILARELFDNEKNLHRVQSLIDNEWVEIYRQDTEIPLIDVEGITSDLQSLMYRAYDENGFISFYQMDLKDGKTHGPIFQRDDKEVEQVILDVNRIVHGVRYSGFRPSYDFFEPEVDKLMKGLMDQYQGYSVWLEDYTNDLKSLIIKISGFDMAVNYYRYQNNELKFIVSSWDDVPPHMINQVFETKIKARDGLRLPTLLTLPQVNELKNLPAIMLPHGGPEAYDRVGFYWLAQYFASRGYLVMQPQFRGSKGFGWDFKQKGHGEWGKKMQDDLTDTVKTLAKSGYIDPERVCIVGISYGGYAALAGASFTPDLYKCAISINGLSDIEKMMRDIRYKLGSEHSVLRYWEDVVSEGEVDKEHLREISPINHIDKIKIPVLLIHGSYDKVVKVHQSEKIYEAMKEAGKSVKYIELEKASHSLRKSEHRMKALVAIDDFIKSNF